MTKPKELMLIDFYKPEDDKGQMELYFGLKELGWYGGDDWNDTPYEHNAGRSICMCDGCRYNEEFEHMEIKFTLQDLFEL